MRVVLDTNILARPFCSQRGPAGECLTRLLAPPNALLTSTPILHELQRVLAYPRLRALHGMTDEEVAAVVADLALAAELVDMAAPPPAVVQVDTDDDVIIATAVAGSADVLCTRDAHLHEASVIAYCVQRGIRVMDDRQLLTELRAADSTENGGLTPSP